MNKNKKLLIKKVKDDRIFSGENSASMWKLIDDAKTFLDVKLALYVVACRCQELEAKVRNCEKKLQK